MKAKRTLIALNALLAAILACNLPASPTQVQQGPDLAATITALSNVGLDASDTPAPLSATPGPTETPSLTPTITVTASPTVPQVSVTSATNCRTGPGMIYDLLYTLQPGQSAEVIGKDTTDGYWIIKMPGGGNCWLWGQYAVLSGNVDALPEWPVPYTPTPSLPANPSNLKITKECTLVPMQFHYLVHVELSWVDNASNESGYYVFRNDSKIATLGEDETSFSDDAIQEVVPPPGTAQPITYSIQAFNEAGKSKKINKSFSCY